MSSSGKEKLTATEALRIYPIGQVVHFETLWKGVKITGMYDRALGKAIDLFPKNVEFDQDDLDFINALLVEKIGKV
jgi:hypothetical protein